MKISLAAVQNLLTKVPQGHVTTYTEIARALGNPKAARAVGSMCGKNTDLDKYPCFRVVKTTGEIGGFAKGTADKIRRLNADGIPVKKGKIDNFENYKYSFPKSSR
jgi:O-6-methylguanine DNA methyltransferase